MIFDWDDLGATRVLSQMCQTRDCRDELDKLHYANPDFKATLFAVPGEMTQELLDWCEANKGWIELGVHGFYHASNYECEKLTAEEFNALYEKFKSMLDRYFVKLFKAPGWQISEGAYTWLLENGWMVSDQDYNTHRRPEVIPAYINRDGVFFAHKGDPAQDWTQEEAWHGHVWDCCGNGIQETFDHVKALVERTTEFKFVTEVL